MNKNQLTKFLKRMTSAMLEAGELALSSQKGIINIGKSSEDLKGDTENLKQIRSAKTVIDDQVQEIFLKAVIKVLDPTEVKLDAEETTPTAKLFTNKESSLVLVIDPIDCTLNYISGGDLFNLCIGLIYRGKILTVLVYLPARKKLFFINTNGKSFEREYISVAKFMDRKITIPKIVNQDFLYLNNRVDIKISEDLKNNRYKIFDDIDGRIIWPDAFLKCMGGEYHLVILHTPQIRDVLLGAIVAAGGGFATDWEGKQLVWPSGEEFQEQFLVLEIYRKMF